MNADSQACIKSILGHPAHISNATFQAFVNRKDPKKPVLECKFSQADGSPTNLVYIGARPDSYCAFKISHISDHGNYHSPAIGLEGDGGKYGPTNISSARRKVVYQEDEGGDLSNTNKQIIESVKALLVNKENKDYVKTVLPALAKKMESDDYSEETGKQFLESYEEMNGEFTTNIHKRVYKDTCSMSYNFSTNVFTKAYDEERAAKSYPKDKRLFGNDFETLGIDEGFMKAYEYKPRRVYDLNMQNISQDTIQALKEANLIRLPMAVYAALKKTLEINGVQIDIKFYLDTALVPIEDKRLADPNVIAELQGGSGSSSSESGGAFNFVKRQNTEEISASPKRPKPSPEQEEVATEPESDGEGVGEF